MEVSMSITRRGKYTDSNICMNVQVCDVACLFFLLYANLLVLVTLCEGNHYPFIEERYAFLLKDAKIYWKIFESEEDKKKKVYPRLPDVLGKKDTPY